MCCYSRACFDILIIAVLVSVCFAEGLVLSLHQSICRAQLIPFPHGLGQVKLGQSGKWILTKFSYKFCSEVCIILVVGQIKKYNISDILYIHLVTKSKVYLVSIFSLILELFHMSRIGYNNLMSHHGSILLSSIFPKLSNFFTGF